MDSISEIEEVGEINRYLITRGVMDRIKKQVRNMSGNGTAEAQHKKNNKKTQGKQEKIIKKINSQEADVVEMEDQVGVLNRKIKKTKAEIKAEKDGLKDSEEHEDKLAKDEKDNDEEKATEMERRDAHKAKRNKPTQDEEESGSDKDESEDEDDGELAEEAQKVAQGDNEELNKKDTKLKRAHTMPNKKHSGK